MSKYRYETGEIIRDLELDIQYHTDDIVDLLTGKDLHITELQRQLEEKEKLIERLQGVIDKLRDKKFAGKTLVEAVNAVYEPLFKNTYDKVEELKQQLHSQPAEIVEKIRNSIVYYPISLLDKDKNPTINTLGISKEVLDAFLKEYQK